MGLNPLVTAAVFKGITLTTRQRVVDVGATGEVLRSTVSELTVSREMACRGIETVVLVRRSFLF